MLGAAGTPPVGWMILGSDDGMVDALVGGAPLVAGVGVALTMLGA